MSALWVSIPEWYSNSKKKKKRKNYVAVYLSNSISFSALETAVSFSVLKYAYRNVEVFGAT